ncbi:MAG: type VII secretion protein EssC [Coprobacillaceae bacterium]
MKKLLVYHSSSYLEIPVTQSISYLNHNFIVKNNTLYIDEQEILPYQYQDTSIGKVLYILDIKVTFQKTETIFINQSNADIVIPNMIGKMVIKKNKIHIVGSIDGYHNGKRIIQKKIDIEIGDILQIANIRLEIYEEYIIINANKKDYQSTLTKIRLKEVYGNGFPLYNRSPRVIKKIRTEKIEILNPPLEQSMNMKSVFSTFIPTLLTISVSVGVGIMMGRGLMLIVGVISSLMTFCTNISKYYSDKKEIRTKNERRKEVYYSYLLKVRKILYHRTNYNQEVLDYNYPNILEIQKKIQAYDNRIYERTTRDNDFLELCIGYYKGETLFEIVNMQEEIELHPDILKQQAKELQQTFSNIQRIPLCINLKKAYLGLVGEKSIVHQQLQTYLMQLTFFHSYHDLEIIVLYDNDSKKKFSYLKWYPHMKIQSINVRTNIYNERMRNQVIGSIYQILKERKNKVEDNHQDIIFSPHLLFVIDEPSLVLNHPIMEFLQQHVNILNFSIIYTTENQSRLPENIKTVITYVNKQQGVLVINEGEYVNTSFILSQVENIEFEKNARILAGIVHEEMKSSKIPESVDFLNLYNVRRVEDLPIRKLWKQNRIYENIAVPIGLRGKDDIVYLDVHEKAHGPHGLVAGTTGSGKSEIIQSYILSLAIHFSPEDIGFLLIDYKGGGMANLFKNLPHLLGIVTNLDATESRRALVSIQSELKRRQQIFNTVGVNSINAYTKAFKADKTKEAIPHLFIISDEFAELKKEQPEFMKELISTAGVGRSLGVHLILATQKPRGVVDDQIWSNARIKLCLKVQDEADSREVLKTSDAANITQPGRTYFQVGNNEVYEVFQSAYSGGTYTTELEEKRVDNRVYLINELGQGQVINNDLSNVEKNIYSKQTQLDRIVLHIQKIYEKEKVIEIKRPWLPTLPKILILPTKAYEKEHTLSCQIGLIDIPQKQIQKEYVVNLEKDGNIAFFASNGYGKSTFFKNNNDKFGDEKYSVTITFLYSRFW